MNPKDVERAIEAMKVRGEKPQPARVGDVILDGDSGCYYLVVSFNEDMFGYLDLSDGRVMNLRYETIEELRDANKEDVVISSIF